MKSQMPKHKTERSSEGCRHNSRNSVSYKVRVYWRTNDVKGSYSFAPNSEPVPMLLSEITLFRPVLSTGACQQSNTTATQHA